MQSKASNAHRLRLPKRAAKLLERVRKAPLLPDNVVQMREERAAKREAH